MIKNQKIESEPALKCRLAQGGHCPPQLCLIFWQLILRSFQYNVLGRTSNQIIKIMKRETGLDRKRVTGLKISGGKQD